jgi:hemerythrin-like domain-containing protein
MTATHTTENVPQTRLPRQVAAPDGPVDVKMMYVMHHAFRRDLVMFADAAAVTPAGDRDSWAALAQRWEVFSEILHHHHSGEDAGLWPWLMAAATEDEQQVLEAMEAEHAQIDPILTSCAEAFSRTAAAPDAGTAEHLAERLAAARDTLLAHMGHEESEAMALVQKYMTQQQWDEVVEESFDKDIKPKQLLAAVPWIAHELPEEMRARLLAEAGLPMKLVYLATRGRFARLQARATRHLARAA